MPNIDVNAILAGKMNPKEFGNAILASDRNCVASGSGMIACKAGANRSGFFATGFVMSKCKVSPQTALACLQSIRPIVDISQPKMTGDMLPMDFFTKYQENIWGLFLEARVATYHLPMSIWPEDFKSLCLWALGLCA